MLILNYPGAPEEEEEPVSNIPELIFPLEEDENVARPVYLEWSSVANADSYQLQISTLSEGTHPEDLFRDTVVDIVLNNVQKCSCVVDLLQNTAYNWRVRALVDGTAGEYSKTGRFETL